MREVSGLETLGDVGLFFEDVGPLDAMPLVFLHGGPGYNAYSFRALVGDALEDLRVVYFDQRGCGRSEELEPDLELCTIDALVNDVEALREFLGLESFVPLGHGFGAVLALEYARRFPARVRGVVVVNPWVHFPELAQTLLASAARLTEKDAGEAIEDPEETVERAFSLLNSRDLLNALHFPDARSRMHLEFVDSEAGLLAGGTLQEGLVTNGLWGFEYPAYLSEIRAPVVVLAGTRDGTSWPGQVHWLEDFANATTFELEGLGHYPWVDDLEVFLESLHAALRVIEA